MGADRRQTLAVTRRAADHRRQRRPSLFLISGGHWKNESISHGKNGRPPIRDRATGPPPPPSPSPARYDETPSTPAPSALPSNLPSLPSILLPPRVVHSLFTHPFHSILPLCCPPRPRLRPLKGNPTLTSIPLSRRSISDAINTEQQLTFHLRSLAFFLILLPIIFIYVIASHVEEHLVSRFIEEFAQLSQHLMQPTRDKHGDNLLMSEQIHARSRLTRRYR